MILLYVFLVVASQQKPPLCFDSTGQFKVLQLTDTHYDFLFDDVPHTVIELEKPDLVVLTGDLTSGYLAHGLPGWYLTRWLLTNLGVKWTYALGNHDGEADLPQYMPLDLIAVLNFLTLKPVPRKSEIQHTAWRFLTQTAKHTKPHYGYLIRAMRTALESRAGTVCLPKE